MAGQIKTARECALSLLERRDRTEKEMRQKLWERKYQPEEIEHTLSFLKEYRYIDDAEYARRHIRVNLSRKSIRQIRYELEKKGVSRERILEGFSGVQVDEDIPIRKYLQKKGYCADKGMEPEAYQKLIGALCRKGFSYESVHKVMKEICEEG